ncbi:MAG: DUF1223 domain-containing protein [Gammaproteobacteria bacterium]|nr:DUF1223 domain-containing protein [Gammaproteobacteria bacterium]
MKKLLLVFLLYNTSVFAETKPARQYETGPYQTHLLELYTSEGCSSCPPAEAWLASLKPAELEQSAIIPLVFHVTYWDYIGWKDQFAQKQFDLRQRQLVTAEGGSTVYTPQFFINSSTERNIAFAVRRLVMTEKKPASIKITAAVTETEKTHRLELTLRPLSPQPDGIGRIYIAAYENGISSAIQAGENKGRVSLHEYLVRQLQSALVALNETNQLSFEIHKSTNHWSGMVVFVESGGQVIEALKIGL